MTTTKTKTTKTEAPQTPQVPERIPVPSKNPIKQELSGKGKTRVQIAQEAVERLEAKLNAAKVRLVEAKAVEEARAVKAEASKATNLLKAAKALRAVGNIAMAEQLEAEAKAVEASQA